MTSIITHGQGVYLIHLDTPLAHARHYLGYAYNVQQRVATHKAGQGARMLQVCVERGISFRLARVWRGKTRSFERLLKNRKNSKLLCPVCNPFSAEHYPTYKTHHQDVQCPF